MQPIPPFTATSATTRSRTSSRTTKAIGDSAISRNLRLDTRWGEGDADRIRTLAAELVPLAPDVVLAPGGTVVGALQQASRTVPIVFVNVTDPIGRGYVASLSQPGGNATGFTSFEFAMGTPPGFWTPANPKNAETTPPPAPRALL
jgi:ABC-type uncharacterized transport system substrate-binding protein